jgi:CubicO group peptidase (beta-lactamase class C family)
MDFIHTYVEQCHKEQLGVLYAQMRKGGKIVEEYSICPQKTRLNAMSVSKSFVSAAVGIALQEGLLSLEEKICDAFPEYVPEQADEYLLKTQVRHLLTMTTGLESSLFFADWQERYEIKDWVDYFFHANFDHDSGERFLYSNFNTYMIGVLIEKRCGQNLLNYLRDRLFEPIGIGNPEWTLCPKGHCYAANGLNITIDELGRFGELLLHEGNWEGRQIVPADYLKEATRKQVETTTGRKDYNESFGYGYQFWMTPLPDTYLCSGNYGQYCLVMPKKDMVLAVMSFEGNRHKRVRDVMLDMAKEL